MVGNTEVDSAPVGRFLQVVGEAEMRLDVGVFEDALSRAADGRPRTLKVQLQLFLIEPKLRQVPAYCRADTFEQWFKGLFVKQELVTCRISQPRRFLIGSRWRARFIFQNDARQ